MGPLLVLALLTVAVTAEDDMIYTPEMVGSAVVEATVNSLESACIFPPNQLYLRRLAFVESVDGDDPLTFLPGYHGGIWRVDEDMFLATQTDEAWVANRRYITRSERRWGIQWMNATWEDLRKPIYSAMGALMYTYLNDPRPYEDERPPWALDEQAEYWVEHYRHSGDPAQYIADSELIAPYCNAKIDLVFLIDESSSIGALNVPHIKNYMKEVVNAMDIGPDATRVGILKFGQILSLPPTNVEMYLSETTNADDLINTIDFMRINGGNTPTDLGLERAREEMYTEEMGARPLEEVVRRTMIVFTDGQSDNPEETKRQARLNRRAGLNSYVVAVYGHEGVDMDEIREIASPSRCKNVNMVETFPELDYIRDAVVGQVCTSPLTISEGCWTIPLPAGHQECLVVLGEDGTTLEMTPEVENVAFLESSQTYPTMVSNEGNIRIEKGTTEQYTVEPLDEGETIEGWREFMYCAFISEGDTNMDVCVEVTDINCCVPNPCNNRGDEDAGCTFFGLGQCECSCSAYEGRTCEDYYPGNADTLFDNEMPSVGHWKEVLEWECAPGWVGDKCDIADV